MANKLKDLMLTSVDLVKAGANQEAHINLYKSADVQIGAEAPTEDETNLFKRFLGWVRKNAAEDAQGVEGESHEASYSETMTEYADALAKSIRSIHEDPTLDEVDRYAMIQNSLGQYAEAVNKADPTPDDEDLDDDVEEYFDDDDLPDVPDDEDEDIDEIEEL